MWKSTSAKEEDKGIEVLIDELLEIYLDMQTSNNNPEYIKLNNKNENNKKEGGCCKGKGHNKNIEAGEKAQRDKRINTKFSTISADESNNKDDDEDF